MASARYPSSFNSYSQSDPSGSEAALKQSIGSTKDAFVFLFGTNGHFGSTFRGNDCDTLLTMNPCVIIDKLKLEFKKEIKSEPQVVYILVAISKLLEHDKVKQTYPTITFYRDWAVHSKLDRSPEADDLVRLFDDYITSKNSVASERLKALVSPMKLREELTKAVRRYDLDFPCCNQGEGILWKQFVKQLAGVIDGISLNYSLGKGKKKTNHVKSVTVSRHRNYNGTAMLRWEAEYDGSPPAGVDNYIEVVLLPNIDNVGLP